MDTINYLRTGVQNTDYFEVVFFKKGKGQLYINDTIINIHHNSIVFISAFQKRAWKLRRENLDF